MRVFHRNTLSMEREYTYVYVYTSVWKKVMHEEGCCLRGSSTITFRKIFNLEIRDIGVEIPSERLVVVLIGNVYVNEF